MNILRQGWLSQAVFVVCGLAGVFFMGFLPDKEWWHWFIIALTVFMMVTALKEINEYFHEKKSPSAESVPQHQQLSTEHFLLRRQIIENLRAVVPKAQRYTENGYFDGNSLRFVDTQDVILCTITLESHRDYNLYADAGRAYDMERTYCIMKRGSLPIRTICDAMFISHIDGEIHIDTWIPPGDHEWMLSDDHIATDLELHELNDYLRVIVELS